MATKQKRTTANKSREGVDVLNDIRAVAQEAIKAAHEWRTSGSRIITHAQPERT